MNTLKNKMRKRNNLKLRKRNNLKCNGFRSAFVLFCNKVCSYIFVTNENDKMVIVMKNIS